jgi:hypothetical protein
MILILLRFKLLWYKFQRSDQIQEGCEILCFEIHKLIESIWNKEDLPDQWKKSIIIPVHKKGDKIDCSNYQGISLQLHTKFCPIFFSQG